MSERRARATWSENGRSSQATRRRPRHDPPRAHLENPRHRGTRTRPTTEVRISPNVAGGAVIAAQVMTGPNIELAHDLEMTLRLPSRSDRSHLSASVAFEAGVPKLTKLDLSVPKVGELSCPSVHCSIVVTMPQADPKRGSPLAATFEGEHRNPGGDVPGEVAIDTYVRDVVGRSAFYGAR